MYSYLVQEKYFLENLKNEFEKFPDAYKVDTFLQSKFISYEEISPAVFIEYGEKGNSEFFKSIGKSVYHRFKERFYTFVNKVFFEILGKHFSLDELTDPENIKQMNLEFKELIEKEPLFNDFFVEIVPQFNNCDNELNTDCPIKLAQLVSQCDYCDYVLNDAENKRLEEKIEWIYELSSLYFEGLNQINVTEEECWEGLPIEEISKNLGSFVKSSVNKPLIVSNLTVSSASLKCALEVQTTYSEICCGPKSPTFVHGKLIAKSVGGSFDAGKKVSRPSHSVA